MLVCGEEDVSTMEDDFPSGTTTPGKTKTVILRAMSYSLEHTFSLVNILTLK